MSKSSIGTTNLLDTVSPSIPIIKDVSVNNLGQSVINWEESEGADLYIVYIQDNSGAWITLDSVDAVQNSYLYQASQADIIIERFNIRAVDSCGNSRLQSLEHNSILLTYNSDACEYSIQLDSPFGQVFSFPQFNCRSMHQILLHTKFWTMEFTVVCICTISIKFLI